MPLRQKSTIQQLMITASFIALLTACSPQQHNEAPSEQAQVDIMVLKSQPLSLTSELPGRVEPVRIAEVRARVAGIILERHFEEGSDVTAGQLLFTIDPAPLKAALARAQGEEARAEAMLNEAMTVIKRYQPLVKTGTVSQQDFDTADAAVKTAQAALRSASASVETARLDLEYATVKAPIAGRISRAAVTEGALVGQGEATTLAIIQQLDPVYVDFKQSIADIIRLRMQQGSEQSAAQNSVVSVVVEGFDYPHQGSLLFSDASVERQTGQLSLRASFPNPEGLLLPGMFVRVNTIQGSEPDAILIPQRFIQRGNDGNAQVLIVDDNNTVQARPVKTGSMQGTLWHITEGLKNGDKLIVSGPVQPETQVAIRDVSTDYAQ